MTEPDEAAEYERDTAEAEDIEERAEAPTTSEGELTDAAERGDLPTGQYGPPDDLDAG